MDEVERKSVMLDVLYEDKDVLVVVKPAGIESQTSRRLEPDMVSEIKNYLHRKAQEAKKLSTGLSPKASTVTVEPYVGVIHRLDKPVRGVMVYAKNQKAAAHLSRQVQDGKLEKIYQVCRTTVRNAVKILVQEGLVEVRQGSGTRVLNHKAIQNYNKVTSVTESLMKKGYRVTTSDMMIDIISADKQLADELEIPEGTSVARIQRLQLADEEPVTLMENYIEYAKVPGIEAYENQFVALYQFLEEKFGLQIDETRDRISAKSATFMEAQVLKTEPKDALLVVHRVTYWQNRPVSIDHVRIIGSKYEVEISGKGRSK